MVHSDPSEKVFAKNDTTSLYSAVDIEDGEGNITIRTVSHIDTSKKAPSIYIIGHTFNDGTVSTICSRDYKDPKVIVEGCDTLAIKEATKKGYALAGGGRYSES